MTFLGRIFSTILVFLSLTFMVLALVANASHRNWRDVVLDPENGLKRRVELVEQTNQQLRDSRQRTEATLAREQAARRTALAALQTQLDDMRRQLQTSEQTVQSLQATNNELVQTDRSRAEELARLTQANETLEQKIISERADRDAVFAQALKLTDEINQAVGLLETERKRKEQLASTVSRYTEVLDAHGINPDDPLDGAPPDRNGVVLAVNRPSKLVAISIGYDEGLREGHTLHVTRNGRYIGKLLVKRTEPDRAVAEILEPYLEGPIQENDRVDTHIE